MKAIFTAMTQLRAISQAMTQMVTFSFIVVCAAGNNCEAREGRGYLNAIFANHGLAEELARMQEY